MTTIQSININCISHSTTTLPTATAARSTTTALSPLLLARLANNLQKMSSHYIAEEYRIKNPEQVVEVLRQGADVEFIEKISTVAANYIEILSRNATLDEWCEVGTKWRNLKEKIDKVTSIDSTSTVNHTESLWKLPSPMHARILSYLSNEDVLLVSYVAKGALSTMARQDETLWEQRAIYQLGEFQAKLWKARCFYLHVPEHWKKKCLSLTFKGMHSSEFLRFGTYKGSRFFEVLKLGTFKSGYLNGPGTKITPFVRQEGIFIDDLLNGPGKMAWKTVVDGVLQDVLQEEGSFVRELLHGQGKRVEVNSKIEIGVFEDGTLIKGKRTYHIGNTEEGTFEFGMLIQGTKKFASGVVREEEGSFVKSRLHGQGKRISNTGSIYDTVQDVLQEGSLLENGCLHDKGKRILNQRIEIGEFSCGIFFNGKRTFSNGNTEEGKFAFGRLVYGTKKFASGVIREEEGSFLNGRLHGRGKRILNTGKVEEGKFEYGELCPVSLDQVLRIWTVCAYNILMTQSVCRPFRTQFMRELNPGLAAWAFLYRPFRPNKKAFLNRG